MHTLHKRQTGGEHMDFPEHLDTILDRTELTVDQLQSLPWVAM